MRTSSQQVFTFAVRDQTPEGSTPPNMPVVTPSASRDGKAVSTSQIARRTPSNSERQKGWPGAIAVHALKSFARRKQHKSALKAAISESEKRCGPQTQQLASEAFVSSGGEDLHVKNATTIYHGEGEESPKCEEPTNSHLNDSPHHP